MTRQIYIDSGEIEQKGDRKQGTEDNCQKKRIKLRVRLKLKPGQPGTKHFFRQYGDRLVCVRYRYDEKSQKRYTTVELIVAEEPWRPDIIKPDAIVRIVIGYDEVDLRQKVKEAGGKWSKTTKTWKIPYKTVRKLGLMKRIIGKEIQPQ
jgi:hypothetical protein